MQRLANSSSARTFAPLCIDAKPERRVALDVLVDLALRESGAESALAVGRAAAASRDEERGRARADGLAPFSLALELKEPEARQTDE